MPLLVLPSIERIGLEVAKDDFEARFVVNPVAIPGRHRGERANHIMEMREIERISSDDIENIERMACASFARGFVALPASAGRADAVSWLVRNQ